MSTPSVRTGLGTNATSGMGELTHSPRFASMLVARSNTDPPSDLEVALRCHCGKIRVHQRLSGAHLILPNESSLAIRVYYPSHLVSMHDDDDDDGMPGFASNFKWKVVFFVLPENSDVRSRQFKDSHSFYRRTLRLLDEVPESLTKEPPVTVNPCWVVIVSETDHAISALMNIADAITPMRQSHRQEFSRRQRAHFFIDDNNEREAAAHAAAAFRKWAGRSGMATGEADVLLRLLGSVEAVVTAAERTLQSIPVDSRSKALLGAFFESHGYVSTNAPQLPEPMMATTHHERTPFPPPNYDAQHRAPLFPRPPPCYQGYYYQHAQPQLAPPVIAHSRVASYEPMELTATTTAHPTAPYIIAAEQPGPPLDAVHNHTFHMYPSYFGAHDSRSVFPHLSGWHT